MTGATSQAEDLRVSTAQYGRPATTNQIERIDAAIEAADDRPAAERQGGCLWPLTKQPLQLCLAQLQIVKIAKLHAHGSK